MLELSVDVDELLNFASDLEKALKGLGGGGKGDKKGKGKAAEAGGKQQQEQEAAGPAQVCVCVCMYRRWSTSSIPQDLNPTNQLTPLNQINSNPTNRTKQVVGSAILNATNLHWLLGQVAYDTGLRQFAVPGA